VGGEGAKKPVAKRKAVTKNASCAAVGVGLKGCGSSSSELLRNEKMGKDVRNEKMAKNAKDAVALAAAVACLAADSIMDRILMCECVSFTDVAAVLDKGGVKLSQKLLGHLLDQQGITHLGVGSGAIEAGPGRGRDSATVSAAEDDEQPRARARGGGPCKNRKRTRYK